MKRLGIDRSMTEVMEALTDILIRQIGYDTDPKMILLQD